MCQSRCICSTGSLLDAASLICTGRCEMNLFNHQNGLFLKLTAQQHQVVFHGLTFPTSQSVRSYPINNNYCQLNWCRLYCHVATPPPCNPETIFSHVFGGAPFATHSLYSDSQCASQVVRRGFSPSRLCPCSRPPAAQTAKAARSYNSSFQSKSMPFITGILLLLHRN